MAVLGALILGLGSKAGATPTTFYFHISITDTCNGGGYHGYYTVKVDLGYTGYGKLCSSTAVNVPASGCGSFICDLS